ncbi:hypothetical protein HWV62_14542 [Athelia sp. TMB]|nr:hypothetical protein HWV62_14542 [Athelia sp. TMB]
MSPNDRNVFYLHVVRCEGLFDHANKAPDVLVEIEADGYQMKTSVMKRSRDPVWNEELKFMALPTSSLSLMVKRQSKFGGETEHGRIEIVAQDLLADLGQDTILNLQKEGKPVDGARLIVRMRPGEVVDGSSLTSVIEESRRVVTDRLEGQDNTMESCLNFVVQRLGVLASIIDEAAQVIQDQVVRDEQVLALLNTMKDLYSFVDILLVFPDRIATLKDTIGRISQQTFECAVFMQEYAGKGFSKRVWTHTLTDATTAKISRFIDEFTTLKASLDMGVTVQTGRVLLRTLAKGEAIVNQQVLDALRPAFMDLHGRPECLPGTSLETMKIVVEWATNPATDQNILWLNGVAGSGKSTLSTSLANIFREINCLGAFLFFNRDVAERCQPSNVVRTIAYQLSMYDHRIGDAVCKVVVEMPTIMRGNSQLQFSKLLVEPLLSLSDELFDSPVVIILDAIDECGSINDRKALLKAIASDSARLPPVFRILVVGRPEHDIRQHLEAPSNVRTFRLNISSDATRRDISIMLRSRLAAIRADHASLSSDPDWPGEKRIQGLVRRACGLFVWAATACIFIDSEDPEEQIQILLDAEHHSDAQTSLDSLYRKALESVGRWSDSGFGSNFRDVVGTLLVLKNPMSASAIDKILGLAIMLFQDWDACFGATPLFDSYTLRLPTSFRIVAVVTARVLEGTLKYNSCDLKLSKHHPGDTSYFSEDAIYACRFWVEHRISDDTSSRLFQMIYDAHRFSTTFIEFMECHPLLIYLSVLPFTPVETILYKTFHDANLHPRIIIGYSQSWSPRLSTLPGKADLIRFVRFSPDGERIATGSLHGLLSVVDIASGIELFPPMPLGNTDWDSIAFSYSFDGRQIASVHPPSNQETSRSLMIYNGSSGARIIGPLDGRDGPLLALTFSQDGLYLASSFSEGTSLWDTRTGLRTTVIEDSFSSLVFINKDSAIACGSSSTGEVVVLDIPSGTRIKSLQPASSAQVISMHLSTPGTQLSVMRGDWKIYIYSIETGAQVSETEMQGPGSMAVRKVAFSSDGNRVVLNSPDKFGVWNAVSGVNIGTYCDAGWVSSVAISSDGDIVASASRDKMASFWTVMDPRGQETARSDPWETRLAVIAYSPDGARVGLVLLPSGKKAAETLVRIVDVQTGVEEYPPLFGHRAAVRCLTFSPDGHFLASGSDDHDIRLWRVLSGTEQMLIREAHHGPVTSISISPDAQNILSTSSDHTVCMWCVASGAQLFKLDIRSSITKLSAGGHPAAAFSPDGLRIVTSTEFGDCMSVWDSKTGLSALEATDKLPFHYRKSPSVGFSADGARFYLKSYQNPRHDWDADTGMLSKEHLSDTYSGDALDALVLDSRGRWILDVATVQPLSRVPFTFGDVKWTRSCKNSITLATNNGFILIHFPLNETKRCANILCSLGGRSRLLINSFGLKNSDA